MVEPEEHLADWMAHAREMRTAVSAVAEVHLAILSVELAVVVILVEPEVCTLATAELQRALAAAAVDRLIQEHLL